MGVLKWSHNWKWYRDEYARLYDCLEGDPKAARERALKRKRIILYDPPFPGQDGRSQKSEVRINAPPY